MSYLFLLIIVPFSVSMDSLKRKLSERLLSRQESATRQLLSMAQNTLKWENALEKSWTTFNPDGSSTEWFQTIDGTIFFVNQDGIREIYIAKQKTIIRRIFDRK